MESLRFLLIQNQSYLGKLRARAFYCVQAIKSTQTDTHKQYGPFCGYWDDWTMQAEDMKLELCDNIIVNTNFLTDLREFIVTIEGRKSLRKDDKEFIEEVKSLASDKLAQQKELLDSINERINIHKQLTEQLMLVEAIDGLGDE